ncbi:MAG: UDP-N-acetylmuramoyl-tripeptide--D-alanyl-D-alanine ligase [Micrococcaceae bacterium]
MIRLTAQEIAKATDGKLLADAELVVSAGVTTDSREITDGYLFVAKPGETADGHNFIPKALELGATLILAEREVKQDGEVVPSVIVDDVVIAMGKLAAEVVKKARKANDLKIVGITGSAGKTTTKDLLSAIFSLDGETVAPQGSFNSEVGVPLTVFRVTENTKYLVVEMGANAVGNIRYLCDMVHPNVGVVLCVGTAHAGEFGGVENIALTKGEMVEDFGKDNFAVLNADDGAVVKMQERTQAPITWFGTNENLKIAEKDNKIIAKNIELDELSYPHFDIEFPNEETKHIDAKIMGAHHISNLLAASAAAFNLGIKPSMIVKALNTKNSMSKWRMQLDKHQAGFTVINDAYNANPESMKASLQALAHLGEKKRAWAVLGEMLELGDESALRHDEVGRTVVRLNIPKLIVIGSGAKALYNAAQLEGSWGDEAYYADNFDEAKKVLFEEVESDDVVLFKSSNGSGLGLLGEDILQQPATAFKKAVGSDNT